MHNRFGRLGGIAAITALITLTSGPMQAGQVSLTELNPEDNLLGIHLLSSTFRDVLKRYGQPSEIQAGGPFLPTPPNGVAPASSGGGMGGPGMPGSGGGSLGGPGGGGSGKKVPSKNGFPGSSNSSSGAAGGPGGPGMPGSGGPGMPGSGGGLPGFGPNNPSSGGSGDEGGSPGSGDAAEEDNPPLKETTWWYHDHKTGEHIAFLFNRTGNVIQIAEYGPKPLTKINGVAVPAVGKTRQGVTLGSSMGQVIGHYGWSLEGAHDGSNVVLRFGRMHKIAFQMVNNRVLGITIGITK